VHASSLPPTPPAAAAADDAATARTRRLLGSLPGSEAQAGGAGGGTTFAALQRADAAWAAMRAAPSGAAAGAAPVFVTRHAGAQPADTPPPEYDVVVCGGTLGVVIAAAIARRGHRVAVVERGPLRGRAQDWNLSRAELAALVKEGVMTAAERVGAVTAEFNPGRCAFHEGGVPVAVRDVLNLGVSPDAVVTAARRALEAAGGVVLERTGCDGVDVYDDAVSLRLSADSPGGARPLRARLALDCMGHASPIVRQARWGQRPDGVCLVVGSCGRGFTDNTSGDVIATTAPMETTGAGADALRQQLFWEAFPAGSGPTDRTMYMFTYVDADAARPSLASFLDRYWDLMPAYQGVRLEDISLLRVLFGCFPTFRASPLAPSWDRVLAVGDASGIQSPLSFGGFGALSRHLGRVARGVDDALRSECLDRASLRALSPYTPNLSGAWLFQRAMSAPRGTAPDPQFVNTLLSTNFGVMNRLGDAVLRPFLQDVPQFGALGATLWGMMSSNPKLIPPILLHCGPGPVLDWLRHYIAMGLYTLLWRLAAPLAPALHDGRGGRARYFLARALDAWQYGSGLDYEPPGTEAEAAADAEKTS
jgi:2-polyprenyl-6-methoxyphenol hydroxylase-like FAD-dependent oxidoreductase